MTGYDVPKRSVRSLYDRLRLPKKKCLLSLWQVTTSQKEVSALFMTGYNSLKRYAFLWFNIFLVNTHVHTAFYLWLYLHDHDIITKCNHSKMPSLDMWFLKEISWMQNWHSIHIKFSIGTKFIRTTHVAFLLSMIPIGPMVCEKMIEMCKANRHR
jgi:hypothetical protein